MTFGQSIGNVLSMREGFDGRASRSEFWWFALLHLAVTGAAGIPDYVTGAELFVLIVLLALFLPGLGVTIRRFHDTGRSAWSLLVILVPFAAIFLFPYGFRGKARWVTTVLVRCRSRRISRLDRTKNFA
jgi:uncharacterized membrane protein YhaH (DUF805 family)